MGNSPQLSEEMFPKLALGLIPFIYVLYSWLYWINSSEMSVKNVLVIAYYFPPMGLSGVQRTLKFVKYLPDFGWNPIVLTCSDNSYYAFDETLLEELQNKNIEIFRTGETQKPKKQVKFPSYFKQKMGRKLLQTIYQPDSKIKWKKSAVALGEEILKRRYVNVIFSTAPPYTDFLVAEELSDKTGIPFIVDYRDVWVDNPFNFYITPFHKNYSVKLETNILKKTKKIIVTSRHTKELLISRYKFLSHDDVSIIQHGYDPEDFQGLEKNKPNKKFVITHSGAFQDDRTPEYFLKALSSLIKKHSGLANQIEVRFVGLMRPSHQKLIKKYKLENIVTQTGYIAHQDAVKNLVESDALWLTLNDTVRSPGKLYEYFGASKPMLVCSPEGVIRKTALDSKAAIATNPKDTPGIEQAIKSFFDLWKSGNLPHPPQYFTEQFNRKELTRQLATELEYASDI